MNAIRDPPKRPFLFTLACFCMHIHEKKDLVDKLSHLGLCISYDRVLRLSAGFANSVCRRFEQEQVVCPPKLRTNLFTTAAVDNIDHNPSSTTATDSFHGTGIPMFQHPTAENEGQSRDVVVIETSSTSKVINTLQESYTTVPPLILPSSTPVVPPQNGDLIGNDMSLPNAFQCEKSWLENVFEELTQGDVQKDEYISWAAYHASLHNELSQSISLGVMLPLFKEQAHSPVMIRHSMSVVRKAVKFLNPGQIPVVTFDQPLYAIAKQVQ